MKKIKVWDIPTRIFHWALLIGIAFMWYSSGDFDLMEYHMIVGRLILCMLVYRIIWGFVGSTTARFSNFIRSPFSGIRYLFGKDTSRTEGHNPAGGWMILALMLVLLMQATTGLFADDNIYYSGPFFFSVDADLADWLNGMHHRNIDYLWILIGIHILASIVYQIKGKNLIGSMITGYKQTDKATITPKMRSPWEALAIFSVTCALGFYFTW
jgi:cytochrome b